MRGDRERQANIMLAVTAEAFVPDDHPLRRIKPLVDDCLARLSPRFEAMYAKRGRPSIPPEHLLKGSLLIALFSVRSERQFCEQLRYNLLFKWFLDLNVEDEPFNATTSAWTGRCWRRGPPSRATARGTNGIYRLRRALGATRRWTSGGSVAAARRTCHAQTPRRGSTARDHSRRRS